MDSPFSSSHEPYMHDKKPLDEQAAYWHAHSIGLQAASMLVTSEMSNLNNELQSELKESNETNQVLTEGLIEAERQRVVDEKKIKAVENEQRRDELTGLMGKGHWHDTLDVLVENGETDLGIFFIDLTRFKAVNDKLGHDKGDEVLLKVARVLTTCLRNEDHQKDNPKNLVAINTRERVEKQEIRESDDHYPSRFGGDEFAVLCDLTPREGSNLSKAARMQVIQTRLRDAFDNMLKENPELVKLGFDFAMGSAVLEPGMGATELLKNADLAMYVDKKAQKLTRRENLSFRKRLAQYGGQTLLKYAGDFDDRKH